MTSKSTFALLKQVFETDKYGYIPLSILTDISNSRMLISTIAHQYGYVPSYRKNSHKVMGYKHHAKQDLDYEY